MEYVRHPLGLYLQNHPELSLVLERVYKPNLLIMSNLLIEPESKHYHACRFTLNAMNILFRVAHITPTKSGQFVTLWKRAGRGPIQPFDSADSIDLLVINAHNHNNERYGQFVFPKNVLIEKGIISNHGKGGKRAMRVYCPWDRTESRQAKASQAWQLKYFIEIPVDTPISNEEVLKKYSIY